MVEGSHTDSSKKHHVFDADRICQIVENTNNWLAKGGRVPWQLDHKKTQDANIGDLESGLEARVITPEDLPNPRLRHLVGKIGAFAERLVGKGSDVVNMVAAGRVKTLSPGIDVKDDIIKEISATPTPAIVGLSTFKQAAGNFALTMDEAESEGEQEDAVKQALHEKSEIFLEVINSIYSANEDELQGQDPQGLLMQAVEDYMSRVTQIVGINNGQQDPQQMNMQYPHSSPMPGYLPQQQGFPLQQSNMAGMSSGRRIAAFTLADMHHVVENQRAEFLFGIGNNNNNNYNYRMPWSKPKKQGSLLGTVAKVGAIGLGGAAAIRYGGAGLNAGLKGATRAINMGMKTNPGKINIMGAAGAGLTRGYKGATMQAAKDFRSVSKQFGRVKNAVGSGISAGYKNFTTRTPKPPRV